MRHFLLLCLVLVLAVPGTAQYTGSKMAGSCFKDLDTTGNLILKFHEEIRVRLRTCILMSEAGFDLRPFYRVLNAFPGPVIDRLFIRSEAALDADRQEAEARTARSMPDLNSYFRVRFTGPVDWPEVVDALNVLPIVETVYPEARGEEPVSPLPAPLLVTPDFSGQQDYKNVPPDGINAHYGNRFPGGLGQGVQVIDFERGWNPTHEDLGSPGHLYGSLNPGSRQHGTAVLGEMIGVSNGFGITGIAHAAGVGTVSYYNDTRPNALNKAIGFSGVGDFIILEAQLPSSVGTVPIEWEQATFDVIKIGTGKGIHIFEAAGNGRLNLDDAKFLGRFDRKNRDSGAVFCAASNGKALDPASFTNYGSRIDAHGWGYNVVTTGYGTLYKGANDNEWYTNSFNGTSSASPIVTGAGLVIQGVSKALRNKGLTPGELRDLITATGTPQNSSTKNIGPRPDLKRALSHVGAHLSSDGSAWPGRRVPLDIVDIDRPGKEYWTAVSFGNTPGIKLPDNRVIPVNPDPLLYLSLSGLTNLFPGFKGTLDAKGYATAGLEILDETFMVGLTLHAASVTLDLASATGIGMISNPWPIKISARP